MFTHIGNNKSFLKFFLWNFVNFVCHLIGCKIAKKSHGHSLGSFNNEKSGVHDDMSVSFFRFYGARKLQHGNYDNGNVSWRAHDSFFEGTQSTSIVSVFILDAMTSSLTNLILDNDTSHLWRLSNARIVTTISRPPPRQTLLVSWHPPQQRLSQAGCSAW